MENLTQTTITYIFLLLSITVATIVFFYFSIKKILKDYEKNIKEIDERHRIAIKKIDEDSKQCFIRDVENYKASINALTEEMKREVEFLLLDNQNISQDKLN